MVAGGGLDWTDNSADRDPPGRRWVLVMCCPACDATDVSRDSSKGEIAYWSCDRCGHKWKEPGNLGRDHARIA